MAVRLPLDVYQQAQGIAKAELRTLPGLLRHLLLRYLAQSLEQGESSR